jgi:hypothetical protein
MQNDGGYKLAKLLTLIQLALLVMIAVRFAIVE